MNIPWYVQRYVHQSNHMIDEKFVRKVVKNGRDSYYINIPKEIIRVLKIKEKQKLIVTTKGQSIIVKDWKK